MSESQKNKTRKAYLRMLRIWAGTKWEPFLRYWLGKRRTKMTAVAYVEEYFREFFGYRKKPKVDKLTADVSIVGEVVFSDVPKRAVNKKDEIDLSGSSEVDQGRVGSCACATLCAIVQDNAVVITKNKNLEINWKKAWEHMKRLGIADDNEGSSLLDNIWYGQWVGYEDNFGNIWKLDKVQPISRSECIDYMRMKYQVYTGSAVGSPMCDKLFNFIFGGRKFGHAFRIMGLTIKNGIKKILSETTWKNYGYKKESQFFIDPEKTNRLFSCYVMTIKKYSI